MGLAAFYSLVEGITFAFIQNASRSDGDRTGFSFMSILKNKKVTEILRDASKTTRRVVFARLAFIQPRVF